MSNELKPVAYQKRWFDSNPNTVTYGQWEDWEDCAEADYNDVKSLIEGGYKYEVRELYAIPEGYQLVPIEPTKAMREAFHEADEEWQEGDNDWLESPDHQWKAMLKAAKGE